MIELFLISPWLLDVELRTPETLEQFQSIIVERGKRFDLIPVQCAWYFQKGFFRIMNEDKEI